MVKSLKKDKLAVNIYENRTLMGEAAANDIAACMEKLLSEKDSINMVFAAAPSQNDVLESLLKKHDLPYIRFHELRHSCASILITLGFSLKDIQEWLGHSDIKMTANIYAHLDVARKNRLAETLTSSLNFQNGRQVVDTQNSAV